MRKFATALALALALAPAAASAQGIGVGAKIGTLGYGVDAGLALNNFITVRGGLSLSPEELPGIATPEVDGLEYTILIPQTTLQLGVDLKLLGPIRLMGGVIYRNENLRTEATASGSFDFGDGTFNGTGDITAELDQGSLIPYGGIGFGGVSGSGIGLYVDLAFAYAGDAEIIYSADPALEALPGFTAEFDAAAEELNDELGVFKNFYPVIQIGLRFGLGG